MQLLIEFDNRQLRFQTNVRDVISNMTSTFRHMIVPAMTEGAGELSLVRDGDGWVIESAESGRFTGIALEDLMPTVKDEVRLQFMRSRPDLLWMHAGAVERDGGALLLSGKSGQGKSTMATYLVDHGWRYMTDDVAPVRMETDAVIPFLQAPLRQQSRRSRSG